MNSVKKIIAADIPGVLGMQGGPIGKGNIATVGSGKCQRASDEGGTDLHVIPEVIPWIHGREKTNGWIAMKGAVKGIL